jgi:hypothetical protein
MKAASIKLWVTALTDAAPIVTESAAELLYYRAVTAWATDTKFEIQDGLGGWVDLTKLYEQCKILTLLKGEHNGNEEN